MGVRSILNSDYNSLALPLMYWTLNSDMISKSSGIAKYRTRDSDVVFLDFGDGEVSVPQLLKNIIIDMYFKCFCFSATLLDTFE